MTTGRRSVLLHAREIGMPVLVPVGDHDERVGALERLVVRRPRTSMRSADADASPRASPRDRARRPSRRRSSSSSISVSAGASRMSSVCGLNASPHTAMRAPVDPSPSARRELREQAMLLRVVRVLDRVEHAQRRARIAARCGPAPSRPSGSTSRRSPGPGKRNDGPMRSSRADALAHDGRRRRRRARTGSRSRS